jgi:hypothetical protein
MRPILALFVLTLFGGCGDDNSGAAGHGGGDGSIPDGPIHDSGALPIQSCDPELPRDGGVCDPAANAGRRCWSLSGCYTPLVCTCTSAAWSCADVNLAAGDPVCPANRDCLSEGHVLCDDVPPPDTHCQCDPSGTHWTCHSTCEGCPAQAPRTGDSCNLPPGGPAGGGTCRYGNQTGMLAVCCTCSGSRFLCANGECVTADGGVN